MIIKYEDLEILREKNPGKKIVFCLGTFDLTHVGHILFFENCKKLGDILVVGVGRDSFIKRYKGNDRPILNENIRLKMVDSFKSVDHTFLDVSDEWKGKESHQETLGPIFKTLKPQVYVITEDAVDILERERIAKIYNVEMVILPRFCPNEYGEISTTNIISKIKSLK